MTSDLMLGGLYLLMAMMLVLGSLMSRREPWAKLVKVALMWVTIFGAGFILFTFRDNLGFVAQRLKSEALGTPVVEGRTVRIPMAIDGHFWVDATINGVPAKFLVDSGATVTTVGNALAVEARLDRDEARDQLVRTGNGIVKVSSARADTIEVGSIERRNQRVYVSDNDDLNVIGMSFLSSLTRWGVEGRWLILEP
ncbi:TIGR02281 family clan AA aspartic protease [Sphingomonas sp.]|uniref:retropepsin-like aspartic protease family protein n=1 Tax=Sphingomonas sp. TaxID=28214 RepID=UPI0037535D3D